MHARTWLIIVTGFAGCGVSEVTPDAGVDVVTVATPDAASPNGADGGGCVGATCVSEAGAAEAGCVLGSDCPSGVCNFGECLSPGCNDGVLNGTETGVDCGGLCATKCAVGVTCQTSIDCQAAVCGDGKCRLPKTCLELLTLKSSATNGAYAIDPDGDGSIAPLTIHCDMTSDGGGWTLIHKNNLSSTSDRTDNGSNVAALATPTVDAVAVLPRATIAALSTEFRVLATNGYSIYWKNGMPYFTTDTHTGLAYQSMLKYTWAGSYVAGASVKPTSGTQHASFVCPPEGCSGPDSGHLVVQRFCCGEPNAGFWFNGTQRFAAGYYAGTGWAR